MNEVLNKFSWKNAFLLLVSLAIVLMPLLSRDFGQNGDENVEIIYGKDLWNYYAHGDKQALDYDNPPHPMGGNIQGMQFYGGMFDLITEGIAQVFPSWHIVAVRHFIASLFGAMLILFTGLLAFRLSNKKWSVAFWAALFLLFSPRIFGESMSNGKDIPFATGMVIGAYFLVALLQDIKLSKRLWKDALGLAIAWAIVIGTRSAGGLLFVMYAGVFVVLYFLFNKEQWTLLKENKGQQLKKLALYFSVAFILGYVIGLFTWPYALQSPFSNFFNALNEMSNRTVNLRVLFDGKYMSSTQMPWYYELKWIVISNPLIIIVLALAGIVLSFKMVKQFSAFTTIILLFSVCFPLFYIAYKGSTVYDTWRHVFFVYPFLVIFSVLSLEVIKSFFQEKKQWMVYAAAFVLLCPAIVWTVRSHPNQYVYFNETVGGATGAFGQYDLDYYHTSGNQTAEWVLKNAPKPKDGRKLIVLSNMDGMSTYFRNDTSWIYTDYCRYYERNQRDWDYYITFSRFVSSWVLQNDKWPPANAVFQLKAPGDVPIGVVLERKSYESTLGYSYLQKQNFDSAIIHYEAFLKADQSDEMVYFNYALSLASVGQMQKAVDALNGAINLDASRPEFYDLLAKIYHAVGDKAKEQESLNRLQAAIDM